MNEIHVWGGLAGLLISYLETRHIDDAELRITLQQYNTHQRMPITTWWALLNKLAAIDPVPALGIRIGQQIQVHHLGVLGYLATTCTTLGEVMLRFQRFQPLLHNLNPNLIDHEADVTRLSWDPSYGRSTQLSDEVLASSMLNIARLLTGQPTLAPKRICFAGREPKQPDIYQQLLGCPVAFNAHTLILALPDEALALPIDSRDPHLRDILDQQAEALMQTIPSPDAFLAKLQHTMLEALQAGESSQKQVADKMGVPSRTLYRQLESRAVTYKGLLSRLRFQLAKRYLANPNLSLPEIALMLGYSEQSAFTRAFKGWCGYTPLRYRKTLV